MTYSEPLFNQISRFATSVGFGFVICILYYTVLFIRKIFSEKRCAVLIQDIFFGITATIMSFFYMIIYNNGEVRLNLLIGEITGAAVLYCISGKYIVPLIEKTALIIRKLVITVTLPARLYIKALSKLYKLPAKYIKENKNKKKNNNTSQDGEAVKKGSKNKLKKKSEKRKNNTLKPLKNQNKSV